MASRLLSGVQQTLTEFVKWRGKGLILIDCTSLHYETIYNIDVQSYVVGVMKHVGDALGDTMVQSRNNIVTIGIAPWGVIHKNEELIGKEVSLQSVFCVHKLSYNEL